MHIAADLNLPVAVALLMKQESSSDIFNLRDRAGSSPIHRYTMRTCTIVCTVCTVVRSISENIRK